MNKSKILAVDDQPENLRLVVEILKNDYSVIATTDPQKALELASKAPSPSVILLDVSMPVMDGYQVIAGLKSSAETRDIPVIFVSGDDQEQDFEKGFGLGAFDFVSKPVSPSLLKARVRNALLL